MYTFYTRAAEGSPLHYKSTVRSKDVVQAMMGGCVFLDEERDTCCKEVVVVDEEQNIQIVIASYGTIFFAAYAHLQSDANPYGFRIGETLELPHPHMAWWSRKEMYGVVACA